MKNYKAALDEKNQNRQALLPRETRSARKNYIPTSKTASKLIQCKKKLFWKEKWAKFNNLRILIRIQSFIKW